MKLLIICALLAVVSSTRVSAGVISNPSNLKSGSILSSIEKNEIANLKGKNLVFADFCISLRDHVLAVFKGNSVASASGAIKHGLDVFWDASVVQMKALERLTAQLKNPNAPIEDVDESNPTDAIIVSGMKKIQESNSFLEKLLIVFRHAVLAYRSHIGKVSSNQDDSKALSNAELFFSTLEQSCQMVGELEADVRKRFEEAKAEVVAKDPSMAEVELENVDCLTPKRVLNTVAVCKFIETAKEPIKGILGIE